MSSGDAGGGGGGSSSGSAPTPVAMAALQSVDVVAADAAHLLGGLQAALQSVRAPAASLTRRAAPHLAHMGRARCAANS